MPNTDAQEKSKIQLVENIMFFLKIRLLKIKSSYYVVSSTGVPRWLSVLEKKRNCLSVRRKDYSQRPETSIKCAEKPVNCIPRRTTRFPGTPCTKKEIESNA